MCADQHGKEIYNINFGFGIKPFLRTVFRYLPTSGTEMLYWATPDVPLLTGRTSELVMERLKD